MRSGSEWSSTSLASRHKKERYEETEQSFVSFCFYIGHPCNETGSWVYCVSVKSNFERFYKENINRIHRYVFFRVGRNRDVAEDLVSEIFLKAFHAFASYDPAVSRSAWIYRIAHNHLANHYRDRKETVDLEDIAPVAIGEDGKETMLRRETQVNVEKALRELPKEERRLVTMKYLEGYSYQDMAPILEKTADALKVATFRAMKKLKVICSDLRGN